MENSEALATIQHLASTGWLRNLARKGFLQCGRGAVAYQQRLVVTTIDYCDYRWWEVRLNPSRQREQLLQQIQTYNPLEEIVVGCTIEMPNDQEEYAILVVKA